MFAAMDNGVIYVASNLIDSLMMTENRSVGKTYNVNAGGYRFIVQAENIDQAQARTIAVFRKHHKQIPSGFQIQFRGL